MQQEIERVQIGQLVALDLSFADPGEVPFDALGGDFADEDRVMFRFERDQADVGRVAFVARSRVSDLEKRYFHITSQLNHKFFVLCQRALAALVFTQRKAARAQGAPNAPRRRSAY